MNRALALASVLTLALSGCASSQWRHEALTEVAACASCGRTTSGDAGGVRWAPDERVSCAACLETAITTDEDAASLLEDARELLDDVADLEVEAPVDVELVSRKQLARGAPELAHPNLRAYCQISELIRGDEVVRREYRVFALGGLPESSLRGILAHELVHVAQTEAGGKSKKQDATPAFREGSACWIQYRIHRHLEEDEWANQLLASRDRVYGGGLRRFLRLAQSRGEEVALRLALEATRFPAGY